MSIITLTTDFGFKDYFISVIKASIYKEIPNANIIDISNSISPFNHSEAAYILKNAYCAFPKKTIHIVGVDSEFSPENKHLLMRFDDHYFIGANNGIFSLLLEGRKYDKLVEINIHDVTVSSFPVLDVFVKVAGHLSRKGNMEVVGVKTNKLKEIVNVNPVLNEAKTQLIGSVIYIDNFGNVVTNIKRKYFLEIQKSRDFIIYALNKTLNIKLFRLIMRYNL